MDVLRPWLRERLRIDALERLGPARQPQRDDDAVRDAADRCAREQRDAREDRRRRTRAGGDDRGGSHDGFSGPPRLQVLRKSVERHVSRSSQKLLTTAVNTLEIVVGSLAS